MTNKYLEKVATTVVVKRRVDAGLPESKLVYGDAQSAKAHEYMADEAGREARSKVVWDKAKKLGAILAGVGAVAGGMAGARGRAADIGMSALAGAGIGGLTGLAGGGLIGRLSPSARAAYSAEYGGVMAEPRRDVVNRYADMALDQMRSMYPSYGDYGADDKVKVPIDHKGSYMYVRPSVLTEMQEEDIAQAKAEAMSHAMGAGTRYGLGDESDRGSRTVGLANAIMAASAADDLVQARRRDEEHYRRRLADEIRREMMFGG